MWYLCLLCLHHSTVHSWSTVLMASTLCCTNKQGRKNSTHHHDFSLFSHFRCERDFRRSVVLCELAHVWRWIVPPTIPAIAYHLCSTLNMSYRSVFSTYLYWPCSGKYTLVGVFREYRVHDTWILNPYTTAIDVQYTICQWLCTYS